MLSDLATIAGAVLLLCLAVSLDGGWARLLVWVRRQGRSARQQRPAPTAQTDDGNPYRPPGE